MAELQPASAATSTEQEPVAGLQPASAATGASGWVATSYAVSVGDKGGSGGLDFGCFGSHRAPNSVFFVHSSGCSIGSYEIGAGSTSTSMSSGSVPCRDQHPRL